MTPPKRTAKILREHCRGFVTDRLLAPRPIGREDMLRAAGPGEAHRIAGPEPDASGHARGERGRAHAARDERVGAQILDRRDGASDTAIERDGYVLGPHAERRSGTVGGCHRGPVRSRNHRAAVAVLEW